VNRTEEGGDAVFIGDESQPGAVAALRESRHVPGNIAADDRAPAGGRIVVPKLQELRVLVGHEVDALAVARVLEAAERGLAAVDREHRQLARGQIDLARPRVVGGDVLRNQQCPAVGREIERDPEAAGLHRELRLAVQSTHPDVGVLAVAQGAAVGQLAAVLRPQGAFVARLAVGQAAHLPAVDIVEMQLIELASARILREHETVAGRAGPHGRAPDRLAVEGQLFARSQRPADPVDLRRVAEAGADQEAAVVQPALEAGAPRVLVLVEALDQFGRDVRQVLADAVADLDAQGRGGRLRRDGRRRGDDGGQ